jgi:hypothetical protein
MAAAMDARKGSFMLLPEFIYQPGQDIALGRILPHDRATKLPDPDNPLNVCMPVAECRISTIDYGRTEKNCRIATTATGNFDADVSFFTGVGAGTKGERQDDRILRIKSESITSTIFNPSQEEVTSLLSEHVISGILQQRARPALYIITGLLVASGAEIEDITGKRFGGAVHANADLTGFQVPINLGVGTGRSSEMDQGLKTTIKSDFILAYRLMRLQKKALRKEVKRGVERRWALSLFDDTPSAKSSVSLSDYLDDEDLKNLADESEGKVQYQTMVKVVSI